MIQKKIGSIGLVICVLSPIATASDQHRIDSGLVGPGSYGKTEIRQEVKPEPKTPAQEIKEKYASVLRTDATMDDLNKVFCGAPVVANGWSRDIFDNFSGTQGESTVVTEAQKKLPMDKILSVHKFYGDHSEEGTPLQTTVNISVNNISVEKHESSTVAIAEKSGFKITFKQTIDLKTGDKPKISLIETPITPEEKLDTQKNITDGKMHVALYSNDSDIIHSGGASNAIRRIYDLPK